VSSSGQRIGDLVRQPRRRATGCTTAWFEINDLGIGLANRIGEIRYLAVIELSGKRIEVAGVRVFHEIPPAVYGQSNIRLIDTNLFDERLIRAHHIGPVLSTGRHPDMDVSPELLAVLPTKYR
jgi:hypothetical protein